MEMTDGTREIRFPPFRLDLRAQQLMRGTKSISLRPKTWDLLLYFARRPGELVSKDELMEAVWGDVTVTISSLNQAVLELRRVLGDDARNPKFIETVHRKGFRFVGGTAEPSETDSTGGSGTAGVPAFRPDRVALIGRDRELRQLEGIAAEAWSGRRQMVFITGDPGIGKSSLLEAFIDGWIQRFHL
jgi:DNA-binding winged helix-turn-helix (wHTH) protein